MSHLRTKTSKRAMSFAELLAVITIAIILFGLSVYSSGNIVRSTKVSKIREEHRVISHALQNFAFDSGSLPTAAQGLIPLMSGSKYLASLPQDPFQPGGPSYCYIVTGRQEVPGLLVSIGPDGVLDLPTKLIAFAWMGQSTKNALNPPIDASAALMPKARTTVTRTQGTRLKTSDILGTGSLRLSAGDAKLTGYPAYTGQMQMSDADLLLLQEYVRARQYDASKDGTGDIITQIGS